MASKRQVGIDKEQQACHFLQKQGLKLISKNFSCRLGEIDLIMQDKEFLVFIEVRYRKNTNYGGSAATVTHTKQQKIIKTAQYYLQSQRKSNKLAVRFDVIAMQNDNGKSSLSWIKSAFQT